MTCRGTVAFQLLMIYTKLLGTMGQGAQQVPFDVASDHTLTMQPYLQNNIIDDTIS